MTMVKKFKLNGYIMDINSETIISPKGKIIFENCKVLTKSKKGRFTIAYMLFIYLNGIKECNLYIQEIEKFVKVKVSVEEYLKWSKNFDYTF